MDDTVDPLKIKIEKAKRQLPLETANAIDSVDWKVAILGMRIKHGYTFEQLGDLELETELLLSGLISPEDYPKELSRRMGISGAAVSELVNEMNDLVFKKIREELVKNTERKKIFTNKIETKTEGEEVKVLSKDIIAERALLNKDGIEIIDRPAEPGDFSRLNREESSLKDTPTALLPSREEMLKKIEEPAIPAESHNEKKEEVHPVRSMSPQGDSSTLVLEKAVSNGIHPLLAQKLFASIQIPTVKTDHSLENITKPSTHPDETKTPLSSYPPKADPYRLSPDE